MRVQIFILKLDLFHFDFYQKKITFHLALTTNKIMLDELIAANLKGKKKYIFQIYNSYTMCTLYLCWLPIIIFQIASDTQVPHYKGEKNVYKSLSPNRY